MTALDGWENFYVIIGSSAGALIGLQFVVITLIADLPAKSVDEKAGGAFTTPSVVHFCVVLFLSAIVSAPWKDITPVAVLWGLTGFTGLAYSGIVTMRMRTQTVYTPVFEDWLFHALLPLLSYATLAASSFAAGPHTRTILFLVAGSSLLLLFVGIHNAWDAVTYHVFVRRRQTENPEINSEQSASDAKESRSESSGSARKE